MNRREFLVTGAGSAIAAAGIGVPAAAAAGTLPIAAPDMTAYLARVDAGLERIGRWSPTAEFPRWAGDRPAADALARDALQALFLTGMFGDLPRESQLHAGMQDRLYANLGMLDRAYDGMTAYLRSRTPADLARAQAALRQPSSGSAVRMSLDAEAAVLGVSEARRAQTRSLFEHAEWRLRTQPPALVVGEYLDKVERLTADDVASEAREREVAARVGEELFWRSADDTKRRARIRRGAKVMGIGFLTAAVGVGAAWAGAFPMVIVGTIGVVIMIVGLLILVVGLATPGDPPPTPASSGAPPAR